MRGCGYMLVKCTDCNGLGWKEEKPIATDTKPEEFQKLNGEHPSVKEIAGACRELGGAIEKAVAAKKRGRPAKGKKND